MVTARNADEKGALQNHGKWFCNSSFLYDK